MEQKQKSFRRGSDEELIADPVNRKILRFLREDSRLSYAELGKMVFLSPPAVYERVRRLEKAGVIRGHTVVIDPNTMGLSFCAFVRIATCGQFPCEDIAEVLAQNPEVEECHSIAGEDNMLIKTRTTSPAGLENLLRKIRKIPGITKTLTTVVLETRFERGIQVPLTGESDKHPGAGARSVGARVAA